MTLQFVAPHQDRWRLLGGEDGPAACIDPTPHRLLSVAQWRAFRAAWPAGMPVGVLLANDADVSDLATDLPRLGLIALQFPKWTDGRAYSQAHLLRMRHRFTGQVRATGEVLVDMLPLLARSGFDAVVLRPDQSLDAAHRALGFFPGHYQGDAIEPLPLFAQAPGNADALAHRLPEAFAHAGASI